MFDSSNTISSAEAEPPLFAGIDLGGTNTKVGLVDNLGRTLAYVKVPTAIEEGPEAGAARMGQGVKTAAAEAGVTVAEIARVGLATPGTMDLSNGMLLDPVNLPGWHNFPIRDRVAHHTDRPVSYANDAAAAAFGEFWVGSGRQYDSMVLLTLGTGIGGGIIIGDLALNGETSHGAECGHIIIDCRDDARICSCDQPGHLEAYASATAVVARTEEALAAGRPSSLSERRAAGEELTTLMLAEEAERGDELSLEVILETARYLGIGIVTLLHTIDPGAVLLGGAMTFGRHDNEIGRQFLARVKEEVRHRAFPVVVRHVTIDFAALGGDAGYIGAAGIARLAHQQH
ncbi:MAG: ROK family protein [Planctomycetota bacterium]|nr:MAG: ROK family protein [Planctomycetota bacterium]REJ95117.1 MAG: ROK family protein [Planctomycetota bacterium]REK23854.1 MAG: ROK family protein [Planctomycetota bacterium]REK44711.1 MAG: ROK family protein [Planctomycetota bacterium]